MTQDTRTRLLDSAEQAARARGIDGFSYADLAKAVGIRKASIHYHFPAKADLSIALMTRYRADMQRACADIEADTATAGQRLLRLIDHYRKALHGGESLCLCVAFSTSVDSLPDEVLAEITAFRADVIRWITSVFEQGARDASLAQGHTAEAEARATLALLEGALLAARVTKDVATFDAAVELLEARARG